MYHWFRYSLSIEEQIASRVANQITAFAIVYLYDSTNITLVNFVILELGSCKMNIKKVVQ